MRERGRNEQRIWLIPYYFIAPITYVDIRCLHLMILRTVSAKW